MFWLLSCSFQQCKHQGLIREIFPRNSVFFPKDSLFNWKQKYQCSLIISSWSTLTTSTDFSSWRLQFCVNLWSALLPGSYLLVLLTYKWIVLVNYCKCICPRENRFLLYMYTFTFVEILNVHLYVRVSFLHMIFNIFLHILEKKWLMFLNIS